MHTEKKADGRVFSFFLQGSGNIVRASNSATSTSSFLPTSLSNNWSMPLGVSFTEHPVSKMDTLAGIAIKYGVEVADIKRMNGLVTDLQMYAHKTLQIPLPGRHSPSPIFSNGSAFSGDRSAEKTPSHFTHVDLSDPFQSHEMKASAVKVSPAMSSLRGYYGLTSSNSKGKAEGMEMTAYKASRAHQTADDFVTDKQIFLFPSDQKSRRLSNGLPYDNGQSDDERAVAEAGDSESEWSNEKPVRRRQKADCNPAPIANKMLLGEDSSTGLSAMTGKGLALRPKSASHAFHPLDAGPSKLNPVPISEPLSSNKFSGVRKSSSTSNLQDSESSSSFWPTAKWTLKPDLQVLSAASIAKPIFDGLPKPIPGRRKAALD